MELQARTLFRHDANGRLLALNEPAEADDPAPRFFLGRTRHGNLWRFRADVPEPLVRELARLASLEPPAGELESEPQRWAVLRERLAADSPVEHSWHGPAFRFPEELPDPGEARPLSSADRDAFAESFPWLVACLEQRGPVLAVLRRGRVVSICHTARRGERAVEAGVETVPEARGQGLAVLVTAAWARAWRERGRIPLYSTSWENRSSRALARKLGLIRYGSDLHMR